MTFSIITATYNRAGCLPSVIRSVLDQGYQGFELLIIDDGSTDGTENVVQSFPQERVRYFRTAENRGVSHARGRGIQNAKGDFVFFLDSDDLLMEGALSRIAGAIEKTRSKYNEYRFVVVDSRTGSPYNTALPEDFAEIDYGSDLGDKYSGDFCRVVKKDSLAAIYPRIGGLERGGEQLIWLRLSKVSGPALFRSFEVVSVSRGSCGSLTLDLGAANLSGWSFMWEFERRLLEEFGKDMFVIARDVYGKHLRKFSLLSIVLGRYGEAYDAARAMQDSGNRLDRAIVCLLASTRARYILMVYHKLKRLWMRFRMVDLIRRVRVQSSGRTADVSRRRVQHEGSG